MLYASSNPHGGDLYTVPVHLDFSANTNPFGTPDGVKAAVANSLSELNHYPDSNCRELVAAIAAFEGVNTEKILCGCGAAELIFSYCAARKSRKALVLAPSFCEYEQALSAQGAEVERFFLHEKNGFELTEAFLPFLKAWQGDTVILCTPNNPTGKLIAPELLQKILCICHEREIAILLDECFLDLTDGGRGQSVKDSLDSVPELTILKAFTKSYGMAGLRLGYCLSANRELLAAMSRQVQPWNVSIPAQKAGIAALQETAFLEQARQMIFAQRDFLEQGLTRLQLPFVKSCANYILFQSALDTKEKLMQKGILIRSCGNYPGLDDSWFRIAVKLPEENKQLLQALEEIIHG